MLKKVMYFVMAHLKSVDQASILGIDIWPYFHFIFTFGIRGNSFTLKTGKYLNCLSREFVQSWLNNYLTSKLTLFWVKLGDIWDLC